MIIFHLGLSSSPHAPRPFCNLSKPHLFLLSPLVLFSYSSVYSFSSTFSSSSSCSSCNFRNSLLLLSPLLHLILLLFPLPFKLSNPPLLSSYPPHAPSVNSAILSSTPPPPPLFLRGGHGLGSMGCGPGVRGMQGGPYVWGMRGVLGVEVPTQYKLEAYAATFDCSSTCL